jgi:predicted permease
MSWRRFLQRSRRHAEFQGEIESYLAHEIDANIARGMTPAESRSAAQRRFGNLSLALEKEYRMNSIPVLDTLWQDLKYSFRQIKAQPGFAAAAVLSLALGIGANTAIFTLTDQIIVRLLPVPDPKSLVQLRVEGGRVGSNSGDGVHTFSYPTFQALRERQTVFTGLTGQVISGASLTGADRPEVVRINLVDGNYFQVFGVGARLGRLLTPDDNVNPKGHPVAVLQYEFWRDKYQSNPGIVGQTIRLNGSPFNVIGVAAEGFEGTTVGFPVRIWVPVMMRPVISPTNPRLDNERDSWFYLYGRLKPGVSMQQAEAAMRVLYRQRQEEELANPLFTQFPQLRDSFLKQTFRLESAEQGDGGLRSRFESPLLVLQWLVAAVLLIACSNVAGLLLARGASRQREIAIRRAIGAGRTRIAAQLLTESALLAGVGGVAGVAIGAWLTKSLLASLPFDPANFTISPLPDLRVLGFALIVTALTALFFGLVPAWQNSAVAPASTLRSEAAGIAGGSTSVRLRKLFVALQVGLSVLLLLGAGLFVKTLRNLRQIDLGIKTDNVVTMGISPAFPYDPARKLQLFRELMENLGRVPGVAAVGANTTQLFMGGRSDGSVTIAGVPENSRPQSFFNWITPGYFEALGIPMKAGRGFTWADWGGGRKLAVMNEQIVKEYFNNESPVGRSFGRGMRVAADTEIIGVFANSRYHDVRGEVPRQTFMNLDSNIANIVGINVYARATGDPRTVMAALRAEIQRTDPNLVVTGMRTLDEQINSRIVNERLLSFLSAGFAVLATLLAVIGLYGVLTFVVARRTREIGIRMALGAEAWTVVRLIVSESAGVILFGIAAGVAAGYGLGKYVENQLYGVKADDALVFGLTAAALLAAAALATLVPAQRAARIDPANALRTD